VEEREKIRTGSAACTLAIEETCANHPVVILLGQAEGTYSKTGKLDPADRWHPPFHPAAGPHQRAS